MNAKEIAEVLAILQQVSDSSLSTFKDPAFVGKLQAECFIKSLPLKRALEQFQIEIQ
jgi:hypothetical protein